MAETIFQKIIDGSVPCYRVYEDAHVLAFLDIAPLAYGHTLVIPKEPAETLDALSEDAAAALGRALPRVCRAVMRATGTAAYNVVQNNRSQAQQAVPHVHFHIIPKPSENVGLSMRWQSHGLVPAEAQLLLGKLRAALVSG